MGRVEGAQSIPAIKVGRDESENVLGESVDHRNDYVFQRANGRKGESQLIFKVVELWGIRCQDRREA